ncbi:MAG: hypothetical protein WCA20_21575 [Candidatus Sulfotelmatobacter sp.]
MRDIEHRSPFHRLLDFGTFVDRDLRVEHTHLARVHAQLNAWTGGRIDLALVNWSWYLVRQFVMFVAGWHLFGPPPLHSERPRSF